MNESPSRRVLTAALTIALSASFLLAGYEFLRSASQSLFIGAYGAAKLPWVMALGPVGTLLMIWVYGRILSAGGARRALLYTCLLSGAAILGCFMAIVAGSRLATAVLYVVREAYIVLLVEQIWAFINSVVRRDEGERLNGPICGVASLGAIGGGLVVKAFAMHMGSANLLVFAAISLVPTALFGLWAYREGGEPHPPPEQERGRQGHLGGRTLFHSATLRRLAILIALTQVVSAVTDLQLSRMVEKSISVMDERTRWFGGFYADLNIGSAVFQFVVTPLLLRWVPLRWVHLLIPLAHLGAAVAVLLSPSLFTAAAALMVFKVLDYSVFRAAKELIYVPLTYDERFRAKELIDAFTYRLSKGGIAAGLAAAGQVMKAVPLTVYPAIAIVASLVWLPVAAGLEGRRRDDESVGKVA